MKKYLISDFLKLSCFEESQVIAFHNANVFGLSYDSRRCSRGDIFFCKGEGFTAEYAEQAAKKGACAIVCNGERISDVLDKIEKYSVTLIMVESIERAMAECAAFFYGYPLERLCTVAVTGTKGKSTTAFYINSALNEHKEFKSALLSELTCEDAPRLTTPESIDLHRAARCALDIGCTHLVCEISSHAQKMQRTHGIIFDFACFTNYGCDHISPLEHQSEQEYFECKQSLFFSCRTAVINVDTPQGKEIFDNLPNGVRKISCSTKVGRGDFWVENVKTDDHGCDLTVKSREKSFPIITDSVGVFNVQNALCACAVLTELGVTEKEMLGGILEGVPRGRGEIVSTKDGHLTVVVDYAHNEMSFREMFKMARNELEGETVTVIFGCPGRKALCRREQLAGVCAEEADKIIICEDDSADEGYESIRAEMKEIFSVLMSAGKMKRSISVSYIESREEAVQVAAEMAVESKGKQIILLLGKGNDELNRGYGCDERCESDVEIAKREIALCDEKKRISASIINGIKGADRELLVACAGGGEIINDLVRSLGNLKSEGIKTVAVCKREIAEQIEKQCFVNSIAVMRQSEGEFFKNCNKAIRRAKGAAKSGALALFCADFDEIRLCSVVARAYKFESVVYLMPNRGIIFGRNTQKNICLRRARIIRSRIPEYFNKNTLSSITGATERVAIIRGTEENALLDYVLSGTFEGTVIRKH